MTRITEELESLIPLEPEEISETRLKGRGGRTPKGHVRDPRRQRWGNFVPSLMRKRALPVEAPPSRDCAQPWELDRDALPKRPPGRR